MTPLADALIRRIAREGPLSVADYMTECLLNPVHGYYATRDPFGQAGDFITAPEISQMFGEVIGLCLAQAWLDRGQPAPFRLVELGPGRGTLMADILRATAGVPGFTEAADIHLIEASPVLRQIQSRTVTAPLTHHDTLSTVPRGPLFVVANEFFDALPTRQFVRDGAGWRERVVGLQDDVLAFGLTDASPHAILADRLGDTKDGDLVETCLPARQIATEIGARIAGDGGMALILDYGDWRSLGDTLQAVSGHEKLAPLATPGAADLTCHVDFEAIAAAAAPALHTRLAPQGAFLERLGITARANALAARGDADTIAAQHRRLTHPQEMGTLFKAMALYRADDPPPPGFSA